MPKSLTTPSTATLMETVERLTLELSAVAADVALSKRLRDAEPSFNRIAAEIADAKEQLAQTMAGELAANRAALFIGYRNISVETSFRGSGSPHALAATYLIKYEKLIYNSRTRENDWTPIEIEGFKALDPEPYAFLSEQHPERIPALIADLSPGNPADGLAKYFIGMRRGYLEG